MSEARINALVKTRDGLRMAVDAIDEYLETMAPVGVKQAAAVKEEVFTCLAFEEQKGAKIGSYEVAYKSNNIEDKWTSAYNILRQSNATINARYRGQAYVYAYWLYGEAKIYRKKLKQTS